MRRFEVWFLAAAIPAISLLGMLYYDITHPVSGAQIAMGSPEDTIGFGLVGLLIIVGAPAGLWALLIWRAVHVAASTTQKTLCFAQGVLVVAAVSGLVANYLELEKRVLGHSNAGAQQAHPGDVTRLSRGVGRNSGERMNG